MNCIVTAGPTYEPLDDVRRLTNFSTGRLGTELANFLAARGHKVTLLVGEQATYSGERRAHRVEIFTTTADLRARLKTLASRRVERDFSRGGGRRFCLRQILAARAAPANWPKSNPPKKFRRGRANCWSNWRRRPKSCRNCAAGFRRRASWAGNSRRTARAPTPSTPPDNKSPNAAPTPASSTARLTAKGLACCLSNNKAAHLPHAPALFVTLEKIVRRDFPS